MSENDGDTQILIECPSCAAAVGYDETEVVESSAELTGCPECGVASPTDDWFS